MYVVVNLSPGADMSFVMATLAERALTFSVTDDLSKICAKCNSKTSQPLPIPHQHDSPQQQQPQPRIEPSPPIPLGREAQPGPSTSTPVLKFRMPPGLAMGQQNNTAILPGTKPIVKRIEIRKKGEEETSLTSEPDPLATDDDPASVFSAQTALNQLAQALTETINVPDQQLQPPTPKKSRVEIQEPELKDVKNEVEVQAQPSPTLTPSNAAAMVSDLFSFANSTDSPSTSHHEEHSFTKREMFRGECRLCQLPISTRTHHMRRHAMKHLGYKTYLCQLCQKDFNRSDLCKSHFERYHPQVPIIPFRDIITPEQQMKLDQMLRICFPEEHKNRDL